MPKVKLCHCGKKSLPGLKHDIALCQFHFDESIWGTDWAHACEADRLRKEKTKADEKNSRS